MSAVLKVRVAQRPIVLRTRGQRHGAITRLVSPSDIGELIKPFKYPHDLVLGHYSVHTTHAALVAGESEIQRIGKQRMTAGLLG